MECACRRYSRSGFVGEKPAEASPRAPFRSLWGYARATMSRRAPVGRFLSSRRDHHNRDTHHRQRRYWRIIIVIRVSEPSLDHESPFFLALRVRKKIHATTHRRCFSSRAHNAVCSGGIYVQGDFLAVFVFALLRRTSRFLSFRRENGVFFFFFYYELCSFFTSISRKIVIIIYCVMTRVK